MNAAEEYRLSEYQDLGPLDEQETIRLKRSRLTGIICVEKHVPAAQADVYAFLASHPSAYLPEIYEQIRSDDTFIIIEEYINGITLEEKLQEKLFTEEEAIEIAQKLCEALRPLHQADPPVICRDLKAENIILDKNNNLKIIDFDIARIYVPGKSRDTRLLGTPEYAAPEQFGYGQTDARADIYAIGVLLNYLTTGKFPADQTVAGPLGEIIRTCTRMDPDQRYPSADVLAEELRRLQDGPGAAYKNTKSRFAGIRDFLPPGFRTGKPWKMLAAVVCYAFLIWYCFSIDVTIPGTPLPAAMQRLEQMLILISQLLWIAIVFNYRHLREQLPLVRSRSLPVRLIGYCAAEIILFLLAIGLGLLAEAVFL